MKVALVLLSSMLVSFSYGDSDSQCKDQMKKVMKCVKDKHEANKVQDDAALEQAKSNVQQCFKDNGCSPPDFNGKSSGGMMDQMKKQWDNQPEEVKECIKRDFKTKMLEKLNQCLEKQHVKKIDVDDMDNHEIEGQGGEEGEKMMFNAIIVYKALKQCGDDHGNKSRKDVTECIKPIVEKIKAAHCQRVSDCKKQSGVSEDCKKRGKEIKDAACKCKKEKLQEAKVKIEELQAKQQSGQDVTMDDMKDVAGRSGHEMPDMNKVEECYTKNGKQPPLILTLLKNQSGQGGLLSMMSKKSISREQLNEMHDVLEEQIKNDHCGCD